LSAKFGKHDLSKIKHNYWLEKVHGVIWWWMVLKNGWKGGWKFKFHYHIFWSFWGLNSSKFMEGSLCFMVVLCYWKLLEAYLIKNLKFERGFKGFRMLRKERKSSWIFGWFSDLGFLAAPLMFCEGLYMMGIRLESMRMRVEMV
jgi:hypothetical protein